jgi:hypothetical protein
LPIPLARASQQAEPSRRSWWKKKRWLVAVALWLAIAHPLGLGPLTYIRGRGWIRWAWVYDHGEAFTTVLGGEQTFLGETYGAYRAWWLTRAWIERIREQEARNPQGPDQRAQSFLDPLPAASSSREPAAAQPR